MKREIAPPNIPVLDQAELKDGTWSRDDSEWDAENNQYICPNADARKITREEHEDARQVARDIAKIRQYEISLRLRKKVEMLFAHLKRMLGLNRLRLLGPNGANDEFLLATTAQNFRKLAKEQGPSRHFQALICCRAARCISTELADNRASLQAHS